MTARHRTDRNELDQRLQDRWLQETSTRAASLPKGLKALWFRLTGQYGKMKARIENEAEECKRRDQAETQRLIDRQLSERMQLQHDIRLNRHRHSLASKRIFRIEKEISVSHSEIRRVNARKKQARLIR